MSSPVAGVRREDALRDAGASYMLDALDLGASSSASSVRSDRDALAVRVFVYQGQSTKIQWRSTPIRNRTRPPVISR